MKAMKNALKYGYYAFFVALFFCGTASAYLDPATVTYVIQIVAGVFIAGGAAIGIFWRRIKNAFRKNGKAADTSAPAEALGDEIDPMADAIDPMADDQ